MMVRGIFKFYLNAKTNRLRAAVRIHFHTKTVQFQFNIKSQVQSSLRFSFDFVQLSPYTKISYTKNSNVLAGTLQQQQPSLVYIVHYCVYILYILYYSILYCTVLHCIYCTILHYIVLLYIVLCSLTQVDTNFSVLSFVIIMIMTMINDDNNDGSE